MRSDTVSAIIYGSIMGGLLLACLIVSDVILL